MKWCRCFDNSCYRSLARPNKLARERLEALIHASRSMLFEMSVRAMHNDRIRLLRWNRNVAAICNSLSCAVDYAELQHAIRTNLPLLGIRGAFVALYDQKDSQQARLLCAFDADTDLSPLSRPDLCSSRLTSESARQCGRTKGALVLGPSPGLARSDAGPLVARALVGQSAGDRGARRRDRRRAFTCDAGGQPRRRRRERYCVQPAPSGSNVKLSKMATN